MEPHEAWGSLPGSGTGSSLALSSPVPHTAWRPLAAGVPLGLSIRWAEP